jgi:hypothetical protein
MRSTYIDGLGRKSEFELDEARTICRGQSHIRKGWAATLVYAPSIQKLIELRNSDEDMRGFARDEAEEVSEEYAVRAFGLDLETICEVRKRR